METELTPQMSQEQAIRLTRAQEGIAFVLNGRDSTGTRHDRLVCLNLDEANDGNATYAADSP